MADNYLEKKMEEFKAIPNTGVASRSSKNTTTLSKLVEKNVLYKEFNNNIIVRQSHLKELISLHPCSQEFVFDIITENSECEIILNSTKASNPQWLNFNSPEKLPKAFIIIGSEKDALLEDDYIKMGMVLQTILLRATEMGLNGTYTTNCAHLAQQLALNYSPSLAVAIGKGKV